jgi:hypothetical protein
MYQRTQRMMIEESKCHLLNKDVGSEESISIGLIMPLHYLLHQIPKIESTWWSPKFRAIDHSLKPGYDFISAHAALVIVKPVVRPKLSAHWEISLDVQISQLFNL